MATNHPGMEACYAQLRDMGYDAAVFDFHFLTQDGQDISKAPHRARVIITCTENNMHKTYEAVDGAWTSEFCDPPGTVTLPGTKASGVCAVLARANSPSGFAVTAGTTMAPTSPTVGVTPSGTLIASPGSSRG